MKASKLFRCIIMLGIVFVSESNIKGKNIIQSISNTKSSFLSSILSHTNFNPRFEFLVERDTKKNLSRIKPSVKKKYNVDNYNEFEDEDNILSLENEEESELTRPISSSREEKGDQFNIYEQLRDKSERKTMRPEIQKQNYDFKNNTLQSKFSQYVISNLQETFDISEDVSRMISLIGSLEGSIEEVDKMSMDEKKMILQNKDSDENDMELEKILNKVNKELNKKVNEVIKDDPHSINRIEVSVTIDESARKNSVQTLKMTRNTKKVINPHLAEKKSYSIYKTSLMQDNTTIHRKKKVQIPN